ncbi:MAG: hypothetical protein V2B18_18910 [Pseudomonadota bacterium]
MIDKRILVHKSRPLGREIPVDYQPLISLCLCVVVHSSSIVVNGLIFQLEPMVSLHDYE